MTIYYVFSNNFVNNIISNSDFSKYDDDFLSYYVNFLKSLTLKINESTYHFFFHSDINSFPLLENALQLYNHPDGMIKNVVRNIFLSIVKFNFPHFNEYIISLPSVTYFAYISCRFKDMLLSLYAEKQFERFQLLIEDITEDIIYIQDILSLNNTHISFILTNSFMYYCILPIILNSISGTKPLIPINIAIYMLLVLFHYVKNETLLNVLFSIAFLPSKSDGVLALMQQKPNDAKGYYYDWNKQHKQKIHSFQEHVAMNYSAKFLMGLRNQKQAQYSEVKDIVGKYEQLQQSEGEFDADSEEFLAMLSKDVLGFFSTSEMAIMAEDHKQLSRAMGVNIGLSTREGENCVMRKVEQMIRDVYSREDIKLNKNDTIDSLLSFLNCMDDNLILLVNALIYIAITKMKTANVVPISLLKETRFISCDMLNQNDFELHSKDDDLNKEDVIQLNDINISESNVNDNGAHLKISINDFVRSSTINSSLHIHNLSKQYIESKDFLGDTSKYRTNKPYAYHKGYIDSILKLFSPQTPFRAITHYVMIHNIRLLTFKQTDSHIMECILSLEHKEQLRSIYFNYLTCIQDTINKHDIIKKNSYSIFERIYNNFIHPPDMHKFINDALFILLPFDITGNVEETPLYLRLITNENVMECFEVNLYVLMLLHDLLKECDKCNENQLLKNYFPLGSEDYPLHKEIELLDLGKDIEQYTCKFKSKEMNIDKYEDSLIVIYNNKIFISNLSNSPSHIKFKDKFLLCEVNVSIDKEEKKVIRMTIKKQTSQGIEVNEYDIQFDSPRTASKVKAHLDNNINNARVLGNIYVDSYLEELFSEFLN